MTPVFWPVRPARPLPPPRPGGAGGSAIEPFPTAPYALTLADNAFLKLNASLDTAMLARAADATTRGLCAAVVDLRPVGGGDGIYQGYNDDDMLYVGSLQKISAMYAAFELRDRVQRHVNNAIAHGSSTSASDWLKMQMDLKTAWQPKLDAAFPKLPSGFPKLAEIFTFSAGVVNFSSSGQSTPQLDAIGQGSVSSLKFLERLKLMLRWSNNHAASSCILALSYPYMNGVLKSAGFFDPGSTGLSSGPPRGLWISGNYVDLSKDWLPDRTANDAAAGQPKTARWFAPPLPTRPKTNFAATARQVARFMALIGLDKLVDAQSCREMRALMSGRELNRPPYTSGTGSFLARALFDAHRPFDEVWGKIGIGDDSLFHDCGIVERTVAGTKSRYAVVGLGATSYGQLAKFFEEVDKGI
ncbi:MAG: hypothetical protein M3069_08510 [Chloroflexota bacterium]|nr:hypothetical protein [Chloroflexota bacterium]